MAEKKTIELEIKSNVGESISDLKALKRQLKDTAAGSEDFKKLYNQIDDLEDKIKSSKNASSDWVDSLESAGGPLGMVGASLNKAKVATQSFGGALKATGIGLFVSLIGGLVAAFSENEGAMKKIQPLLDGLKKAFQGVFRAVEPLFNTFVDLATEALPYVTKGIGMVYSSMMAYFTFIKESGGGVMKILKGIFTLDSDAISEGIDKIGGSFKKTQESYGESMKRFSAGSKELTQTEKEEAEKRAEARKAAQEKQAANDEKAKQERIRKAEEEKKRLEEIEKERQAFISSQGERARDEYEAGQKLIADTKKANEDALKTENQIKVEKENADFELKKQSLLQKGLSIEEIEKEHKRNLSIITKTENDKILADAKEQADKEIALDLAIKEAKRNALNVGLDILQQFAGKNKAIALGILAVTKGLAIADIIVGASKTIAGASAATGLANSAALATPQAIATSGASAIPVIAGNVSILGKTLALTKLTAATSIASIVAAGISGAKSITGGSAGGGSGGSGGGGGSAPTAPAFNVVGASATNQLAQTIGNQQQQPIKTYVLSNDVTTAQGLERNIIQSASIG
jgi:hypothetical protein